MVMVVVVGAGFQHQCRQLSAGHSMVLMLAVAWAGALLLEVWRRAGW